MKRKEVEMKDDKDYDGLQHSEYREEKNDEYGWREVLQPLVWVFTAIAALSIARALLHFF